MLHQPLVLLAALLLGTVAVGRAARLVTSDSWPPMARVRMWWVAATSDEWGTLMMCPFCASPYLAAGDLAWALWSGLTWGGLTWGSAWWACNVWATVSYLSAMLVVRDEPPAE